MTDTGIMSGTSSLGHGELCLSELRHPENPSLSVRIFRDWFEACTHLNRHVLTHPECLSWPLVCPELLSVVDPTDANARWRYAEQAIESKGGKAQRVYDLYCGAIRSDAADAATLHWVKSEGRVTVAIGTSGVLMVIERALSTAFLPGQGDAQATRASNENPSESALSRERGMRSGRPGRRGEQEVERDRIARENREANWTSSQRLYYRVFRPAVHFLRKVHRYSRDMLGQVVRGDYALMKDVLPRQSHLRYEDWLDLRRLCGREA